MNAELQTLKNESIAVQPGDIKRCDNQKEVRLSEKAELFETELFKTCERLLIGQAGVA